MYEVRYHRDGTPLNEALTVWARGPADDGADTQYVVREGRRIVCEINFQLGRLPGDLRPTEGFTEVAINGITDEVLLAILIGRMRGKLNGPNPCEAYGDAQLACQEALAALQKRNEEQRCATPESP